MLDIKITRTTCPKEKPQDETKLGFGKKFTDHMFVMDYTEGEGWHDARIVPYAPFPLDPATGAVVGEDITAQAKQVLENLKAVLEASGAALDTVLKTTCFLADMADFAPFNELYAAYFTGCPARSCVAVKQLPKGVLVEVEAIAAVR